MKSALLLGILFFATTGKITPQNPIASQSASYREASVWIIEFMRTNMERQTGIWSTWRMIGRPHLVLSYKAFIGPPANKEDWDVMTIIEVKDLTSPTEF
jgi:hypothetical protein